MFFKHIFILEECISFIACIIDETLYDIRTTMDDLLALDVFLDRHSITLAGVVASSSYDNIFGIRFHWKT
jgi:hypothetical protein